MTTEQSVMAVIRASRPSFRGAHDKVAYAIHASFLTAGYILNATGTAAFSDDALTSPSTDEVGIEGWDQFDDNYAFVYTNPDKGSKKILVKCLPMNDTLLIDVLKDGDAEPLHLEINVKNYTVESGGSPYTAQFKDFGKLVTSINDEILGKLSSLWASNSGMTKSSSATRGSTADTYQSAEPERQPYNPSGGDFGSGGGSLVGPDHPLFSGRIGGRQPGFPGALPPGVPPGARYDPYGPPGVPGFEPNRFVRNPRRPGGGVHPDLEQFGGDDFI